ncbi:MAG: MerR family transcriptional regulator [Myxococcota bacterium]|nr:MerR family transcriptional regulator [Myxococcota bacterium]
MPEAPAELEAEYTIDELSHASRLPSRTIRFYQSKGVLMAPVLKGRVAYYGPKHKERLELIAQLQDRGLKIDTIREIVTRLDKGEIDVGEWLGLDAQLRAPWADDHPRTVSEAQLFELAGAKRPGLVADLVRVGGVERHGDVFLVRSPALLQLAMKLESAGVDLELATKASDILRRHLAKAAKELTDHFLAHAPRMIEGEYGGDLGRALEALRPLGLDAVRILFAQEMERSLRHLLESGRAARLPTRKKKKR